MPRVFECPFFQLDRDRTVHCEGGRIEFGNAAAFSDYCDRFCGSNPGWSDCTLAQNLNRDYDRRKNHGEESREKRG